MGCRCGTSRDRRGGRARLRPNSSIVPSALDAVEGTTTATSYALASATTSASAWRSAGPATKAEGRSRRSPPAVAWTAADHALSEGLTDTGRPPNGARAPHGTPCSTPVGTTTSGRSLRATTRGRSCPASAAAPSASSCPAASRDAADPCTRLSRCRAKAHSSRCSSRAAAGPRSCSVERPPSHVDRVEVTPEVGVGEEVATVEGGDRLRDRRLSRRRLATLPAGTPRQRADLAFDAQPFASATRRASGSTSGSAAAALDRRRSASSDAIAASFGARTSGARQTIVRIDSIRCSSSLGRPSSIARRAPRSISSAPWWAAWERASSDPSAA